MVRQQLDSYDEFILNTMQEIVESSPDVEVLSEPKKATGKGEEYVFSIFKHKFLAF